MRTPDIQATLEEYARKYQPLITVEQAAEIAQVPRGTIYDWSSRGLFNGFKSQRGRRIRLSRDAFLRFLFNNQSEHGAD
jgi:excisionase family DNA binding protein